MRSKINKILSLIKKLEREGVINNVVGWKFQKACKNDV
jgi:hypothetical protein